MSYKISEVLYNPEEKCRWVDLFSGSQYYNFTFDPEYIFSGGSGKRFIRSFLFSGSEDEIAGVYYSLRESKFNFISVSDIKSGILFRSDPNPDLFREMLDHFLDWAGHNNVSFARINTWVPRSIAGSLLPYSDEIEKLILMRGFKKIANPKHTYWIDLSLPEEVILERMKRQTRYDIRHAEKSGLKTEQVSIYNEKISDEFLRLYNDLGNKKGFDVIPEKNLKNELLRLLTSGVATMFVTRYCDKIVNISIAASVGRGQYLYGAINPGFKELKGCPSPGPFAQWEMIKAMKGKGLSLYDMGFCPGPVPIPDHPKFPIWRFKYGFGGVPVEFLPVYGKELKPITGKLFYLMNKIK